jgi:hypothetical protein
MIGNAKRVTLVVLYCGQGMANWIEILDKTQSDDAPSATMLIDFGRDRFSKDARSKTIAVDYVIGRLQAMRTAGRTPSIDFTVISHQDHDHWALIRPLTTRLLADVPDVRLGPIVRGGAMWSSYAQTYLGEYAAASVNPKPKVVRFNDNASDYKSPPAVRRLATFGDVYLNLLISNLTGLGTSREDIIKNATSAVMVVEFNNYSFVLPGDATSHTIIAMNELLAKYLKTTKPKPLGTCWALGLPHHGSYRTFVDESQSDVFTPGKAFAKLVDPKSVPASAGYHNRHHHPNIDVFNVFEPYLAKTFDMHSIVAFHPFMDMFVKFLPSKTGKFTTLTTDDDPPGTDNWRFWINATNVDGREVVEASVELLRLGAPAASPQAPIRAHAAEEERSAS